VEGQEDGPRRKRAGRLDKDRTQGQERIELY
jgi:hypothetical protein